MSLYLEERSNFRPWDGREKIRDITYQPNIGDLWSAEELAAIGLYEPATPQIPVGKVIESKRVQRVNGIVTYVYTFTDGQTGPPDPLQTRLADIEAQLARAGRIEAALIRKAVITSDDISTARSL